MRPCFAYTGQTPMCVPTRTLFHMSTNHDTFGKAFGNPARALADHRLADSAIRFISLGLGDPYSPHPVASVGTFALLVHARTLEVAAGGGLVPDPRRLAKAWQKGAWEAALDAAYKALLTEFNDVAVRYFGRIAPPWLGLGDDETEARLAREVCGLAPADEPQESDPVRQAYEIARYNTLRCEQRIAMLYALGNIVRPASRAELPNPAAQAEFDATSRHLWVTRSLHVSRTLAFGTLLGGEYLERNKAIVKAMYGEGMSVIELTQVDGYVPSRWPSADEDSLRKAIASA